LLVSFTTIARGSEYLTATITTLVQADQISLLFQLLPSMNPIDSCRVLQIVQNLLRIGIAQEVLDMAVQPLLVKHENLLARPSFDIESPLFNYLFSYALKIREFTWTCSKSSS